MLAHEIAHITAGDVRERFMTGAILGRIAGAASGGGRVLAELIRTSYSRDREMEADRAAVKLAKARGFDGRGGVRVMAALEQLSPDQGDYFSTHPSHVERVRQIESLA